MEQHAVAPERIVFINLLAAPEGMLNVPWWGFMCKRALRSLTHVVYAHFKYAHHIEGIANVLAAYPQLRIVTAAVDAGLDENKYIRPGLGDFGCLYFGTNHD